MGTVFNKFGGGGGAKIIDLGTGTSFNVSGYSGYNNFTIDNFIVEPKQNLSGSGAWVQTNNGAGLQGSGQFKLNKSYNSSTGILSASTYLWCQGACDSKASTWSGTGTVKAYLVIGKIS